MDKDLTKGKGMTVGDTQIGTVHSRGISTLAKCQWCCSMRRGTGITPAQ